MQIMLPPGFLPMGGIGIVKWVGAILVVVVWFFLGLRWVDVEVRLSVRC